MNPTIREILASGRAGVSVSVQSWVRTARLGKGRSFLDLGDGSCLAGLQLVAEPELANFESEVRRIDTGFAVSAEGELRQSPGSGQALGLVARAIERCNPLPAHPGLGRVLARISHQNATAATHLPALTRDRTLRVLGVASATPPLPSVAISRQDRHLRRLATRPGEKSGLARALREASRVPDPSLGATDFHSTRIARRRCRRSPVPGGEVGYGAGGAGSCLSKGASEEAPLVRVRSRR